MTLRMIQLIVKPYTTVVSTPLAWTRREPSAPLISLLASTPVSSAPTMPPMPCTPQASSESS